MLEAFLATPYKFSYFFALKPTFRTGPAADVKRHITHEKTTLPNGVRVLTEQIPHVRSVSIGIWCDTGSRDETASTSGLAHFFEHMVFKGTEGRSVKEIAQSIESVGGYLNAFTGKEHTCFYARVLDEHTRLAADVLSDLLCHATFPEKELEKEKGVVIEEMRNSEDDPDELIHDVLDGSMFPSHPLGRPVIGTEANVRSFTRKDLTTFRKDRYTADRIVVSAAGRLEHARICDLASTYLGSLKESTERRGRSRPGASKGKSLRQKKPIQQAHLCIGTPAYSVKSKERYPLLVLNTLLGDGMSSRLFQSVREKHGLAYSVYSFANLMTDSGTFGVYAGLDFARVEKASDLIWLELEKLVRQPVGRSELRRTKDQLKGSMMLSMESIPNRMMRLGGAELSIGSLPTLDEIVASIERVTAEDISRVAADLFRRERFSTVLFEPTQVVEGSPS